MKKLQLFTIVFLSALTISIAQEKPKVLIGIVVDQMRNDYIQKFWEDYGDDGFKRLVNKGTYATNVNFSYKPTYTGPGHASIFTGTTPANHGIVANNWYSRQEKKVVYCAEALNEKKEYWYSPQRMLARSIADEIKLFTNGRGKSFGVSLKDRGAILPAGHMADAAFWFNAKQGGWTSSDYYQYMNNAWVDKFNKKDIYESYLKAGWELSKEETSYQELLEDNNEYERPYVEGEETSFPYDFKNAHQEKGDDLIKATPSGNQILIDFAKELIEEEEIGKDDIMDFLSISFSSTDYIGHQFGVNSREVHDTYIKLDKQLGEFLSFLDSKIGEGNYFLFLTSDHGAGEARQLLMDKGMPGGYINSKKLKKKLEEKLNKEFGEGKYIESIINLNIYFTKESIKSKNFNQQLEYTKKLLEKEDAFQKVLTRKDILKASSGYEKMIANGFLVSESGDIILLEKPNWNSYGKQGSTHGSPYSYDTHVPLIFYGWNIESKQIDKAYSISQIAATLSNLLGIPRPDASAPDIIKGIK